MIDGQIHNILSVAEVITEIKTILEEQYGPLKHVSVAAAGRALKTSKGSMSIDISEQSLISNEDVNRLELAAVQQAQQKLLSSDSFSQDDDYYCVGYSVLHYKLEGDEIGSLIEQTGRTAGVDVIATFLPRVVVESLLAALKHAELEMEALTLEPIAAINVLIPPSMRRLNVALVDIGAGTSDIAITDDNTVVAYGMVPFAGDEITEALSSHYLLDFPLAETAKRGLSDQEQITMTDILGFEQCNPSHEVVTVLTPAINRVAEAIAKEIMVLNNHKAPQAVMVVGGGSLTPGLPKAMSEFLGLPENRVGIRGLEALSGVTIDNRIMSSPALVTPIGIAIAARRAPIHYITIEVNNKIIRLFELKQMTVGDALLAANIKANQLYGLPGLGITVTVNGRAITIPGEHGTASIIRLNGVDVSSKDKIANGDRIELLPGKDGRNASATIGDLVDDVGENHAIIDGIPISLAPLIIVNGTKKKYDDVLHDRDIVTITNTITLGEALKRQNREYLINQYPLNVTLDHQPLTLMETAATFILGTTIVNESYILKNGDRIHIELQTPISIEQIVEKLGQQTNHSITITFNGKSITITKPKLTFKLNGKPFEGTASLKSEDQLDISTESTASFTFADIFSFTDYQLPTSGVTSYQLLQNGSPIHFNASIYNGDNIEILFS